MHDRNGSPLHKNDIVLIPMKIRDVYTGEDFCNLTLESLEGRKPDGHKEILTGNANIVILWEKAKLEVIKKNHKDEILLKTVPPEVEP